MKRSARSRAAVLVVMGCLLLALSTPAVAHVVEVTTTVDVAEVRDDGELRDILRSKITQALSEAIAFEPTVVTLTDARMLGEQLLVRLLVADEEGERMLEQLDRAREPREDGRNPSDELRPDGGRPGGRAGVQRL